MSAGPTTVGMMCQRPYRIGVVAVVQAGMVELVGIHGVVGAVVATTIAPHIRQPPRAPSRGRHDRVQKAIRQDSAIDTTPLLSERRQGTGGHI